MSTQQIQKEKKVKVEATPEQLKQREHLEKQIADIKSKVKPDLTKLAEMEKTLRTIPKPKKVAKPRKSLSDTVRFCQGAEKSLSEMVDEKVDGKPTGKKIPRAVANRTVFRTSCNTVVALNNVNADLKRSQVETVVREGVKLLSTMPKPPPKPRVKKEAKPKN